MHKKYISVFLLFFISLRAFSVDYTGNPLRYFKEERTTDYNFALNKAKDIYATLQEEGYPYSLEAVSIIFPELIRYSAFQNELESLVNKCLAFSSEKADGFSIGLFQMKPAFAIKVEKIIDAHNALKTSYSIIDYGGEVATSKDRHERILRLNDIECERAYLKAFIDYEVKALSLKEENIDTRIRYLSAAYNYGIRDKREELEKAFDWKTYPSGKRGLYFNYQALCIFARHAIEND